jgi:hypothetical protein
LGFFYQDLDVYYLSLGFVDSVLDIIKAEKPPKPELFKRLEKVAIEIPLSIARLSGEAASGIGGPEYLKIRGFVFESQSIVEMLWRQKLIKEKDADELGDMLLVISNMLADLSGSPKDTERKVPIYKPKKAIFE